MTRQAMWAGAAAPGGKGRQNAGDHDAIAPSEEGERRGKGGKDEKKNYGWRRWRPLPVPRSQVEGRAKDKLRRKRRFTMTVKLFGSLVLGFAQERSTRPLS